MQGHPRKHDLSLPCRDTLRSVGAPGPGCPLGVSPRGDRAVCPAALAGCLQEPAHLRVCTRGSCLHGTKSLCRVVGDTLLGQLVPGPRAPWCVLHCRADPRDTKEASCAARRRRNSPESRSRRWHSTLRAGAEMLLRTFLLQLLIPSSCLCWKWLLQSVGGERTEKGPI